MHEERGPQSVVKNVATALAVWLTILLTVRAFASGAAPVVVPPPQLEAEISARVMRVEEFRAIREFAEKTKTKVYLFGGTAAGFAHYVKWDVQREGGDKTFQSENFDYDYTNIYRSTQDLDIVLDGTEAQAKELEAFLMERYAYMKGGKSKWEVRLLREKRGEKIALLANPDFLNQHTDSNSTGMIEISKGTDPVVRDLRDWSSREPYFLRDVSEGKIHYYDSALHHTTSHFIAGENPPILSVIRYLTKAFQFELEMRPADLAVIEKRISEFDPAVDFRNGRAAAWVEKNAAKLVQNAVNIEYAIDTLDRLGLRRKLIALGDPQRMQTMAWWLAKEPLRTAPLGHEGQTARELKIDVVAHETTSFLAYESITRSKKGAANALISRKSATGEAAMYGDGFYTRMGREGARGTKITIRFRIHPEARAGVDIKVEGEYVIVLNKSALRVIPESLNIGAVDFLTLVTGPDFAEMKNERALMEKLRRRLLRWKVTALTPAERERMKVLVKKGGPLESFIKTTSSLEIGWIFAFLTGTDFEPWLRKQIAAKEILPYYRAMLFRDLGWTPEKTHVMEAFKTISNGVGGGFAAMTEIVFKSFGNDREVIFGFQDALLEGMKRQQFGYDTLDEFWKKLIADPVASQFRNEAIARVLDARAAGQLRPGSDLNFIRMIKEGFTKKEGLAYADRILKAERPQDAALREIIEGWGLELGRTRIDSLFEKLHRNDYTQHSGKESFFEALMEVSEKFGPGVVDEWLVKLADSSSYSHEIGTRVARGGIDAYPKFVAALFARQLNEDVSVWTLRSGLARDGHTRPEFWRKALADHAQLKFKEFWIGYYMGAFHGDGWIAYPDIVEKFLKLDPDRGSFLLGGDWAAKYPHLVTHLLLHANIGGQFVSSWEVDKLLSRPESANHPEWIEIYVRRDKARGTTFGEDVFGKEHWSKHPVLHEVVRLSGGLNRFQAVSIKSLKHAFVTRGVTVAQARTSLEKREARGRGVIQKLLGPLRRAAPNQCHSIFVN